MLCSKTRREFLYSLEVVLSKASCPGLFESGETLCRGDVVVASPKRGRSPGTTWKFTNLVLWLYGPGGVVLCDEVVGPSPSRVRAPGVSLSLTSKVFCAPLSFTSRVFVSGAVQMRQP